MFLTNCILYFPVALTVITSSSVNVASSSSSFPVRLNLKVGSSSVPFVAPPTLNTNTNVCFPGTVCCSSPITYFPLKVLPSSLNTPSTTQAISSKFHFITLLHSSGRVASNSIVPPVRLSTSTPSFIANVNSVVHVTWSNDRTILFSASISFPGSLSSSHGPVPVALSDIVTELIMACSPIVNALAFSPVSPSAWLLVPLFSLIFAPVTTSPSFFAYVTIPSLMLVFVINNANIPTNITIARIITYFLFNLVFVSVFLLFSKCSSLSLPLSRVKPLSGFNCCFMLFSSFLILPCFSMFFPPQPTFLILLLFFNIIQTIFLAVNPISSSNFFHFPFCLTDLYYSRFVKNILQFCYFLYFFVTSVIFIIFCYSFILLF